MPSGGSDRANPYHRFLRRLQAGGRSNMYGAIPYLAAAFGCGREEAFRIVCEWLDREAALPDELQPAQAAPSEAAAPRISSTSRRKPARKASRGRAA
jgi:hypothetical protein